MTIMIEKNKTINELMNLYLYLIGKPDIEQYTQFKYNGKIINFNYSQTIGEFFNYSNDITIDYVCLCNERNYISSRVFV